MILTSVVIPGFKLTLLPDLSLRNVFFDDTFVLKKTFLDSLSTVESVSMVVLCQEKGQIKRNKTIFC
ncbi:hypothetical protein, partial [Senegalia sp. (in: firmicutes)]|uniref:hypothetical protein n=1 Tax=Senegalia sp. (in: firmicutes) TaxID=1924098 RepID=UPI003F97878A